MHMNALATEVDTKMRQRHYKKKKKTIMDQYLSLYLDTKINNKILAFCIHQYRKSKLHHRQMGFIPGMQCLWIGIFSIVKMSVLPQIYL